MGEYADDYFRREVKSKFGFDLGSMYEEDSKAKPKKPQKVHCKKCGKLVKEVGLKDHMRDSHQM